MIDANKEWDEIANFIDTIQDTTHEDDLFDVVKAKFPNALDEIITEIIMVNLGGDCIGIE
jgi:hypothetical protein